MAPWRRPRCRPSWYVARMTRLLIRLVRSSTKNKPTNHNDGTTHTPLESRTRKHKVGNTCSVFLFFEITKSHSSKQTLTYPHLLTHPVTPITPINRSSSAIWARESLV